MSDSQTDIAKGLRAVAERVEKAESANSLLNAFRALWKVQTELQDLLTERKKESRSSRKGD